MPKWDWSYTVWSLWLLLFLALELPGEFKLVPWVTLSETSWHAETTYRILRTILFGLLLGLAVHIRFRTPLWHAEAGGLVIALVLHRLWGTG